MTLNPHSSNPGGGHVDRSAERATQSHSDRGGATMQQRRPDTTPMTASEMRARWHKGDSLASIATSARRRNGMSKAEVREMIFGEEK